MKLLNIVHIYPDLLNLYGDRGNILCLKQRIEKRNITAEVTEVRMGEKFDAEKADIIFIGGGQDFEQDVLLSDLKGDKQKALIEAIEREKVLLAICGGYQMLGQYYKTHDGIQMDFIGALDFYTVGAKQRMIGNYAFETDEGIKIVGFENHSGKTYLGSKVLPLGRVIKGFGNNGEDKTEGAVYKNTFCTYSHGPVLPKNPAFADLLIKKALKNKYNEDTLIPINDEFELKANKFVMDNYINQ